MQTAQLPLPPAHAFGSIFSILPSLQAYAELHALFSEGVYKPLVSWNRTLVTRQPSGGHGGRDYAEQKGSWAYLIELGMHDSLHQLHVSGLQSPAKEHIYTTAVSIAPRSKIVELDDI